MNETALSFTNDRRRLHMRKILIIVVGLFIFTVSLAGAQTLTWTAGGVGGGWYTIAGGISTLINEKSGGPLHLGIWDL